MYLYRDAHSFFHFLHPVTKFLLLILMITIPFFASTLPTIGTVLLLYFLLLLIARGLLNLKRFWKLMLIFWIVTFIIWIIVPRLQGLAWSYATAAYLATRIISFVLAGLLFVTVTRIEEFTFALTRLGLPYKVAFALSLGFRLVPLFYQNLQTIVAAQKSRGVDLESQSWMNKGKSYIPIMGILISYGIRNADLMAMALESKGFGYSPHRTSYLRPRFRWQDAIILIMFCLVILSLYIYLPRS